MPSRNFTVEDLDEFTYNDVVIETNGGRSRWSELFDIVFRADDGKTYFCTVEVGNTEYQEYFGRDRYPKMPYGDDTLECPEVEVYEKLVPVQAWKKVED